MAKAKAPAKPKAGKPAKAAKRQPGRKADEGAASAKGQITAAMVEFGVDAVCERLAEGMSLTAIATEIGVSKGSLLGWLAADTDRSARAREARALSARCWDEQAEAEIRGASDSLSLAKARELAQHYRWRATKIAPRDYGDKVQLADADGDKLPAPTVTVHLVRPG